ncbi:helix-turn-helix domain-containing protein [Microbacterium trichothecenolyticum]|uniref:Transcriptional regulator with XRE-family HTH domain n=1 Tax=Microbacterium trichothecenolyticum TaxID=69370 RepID=A0ABU0TQ75_MICTR|nr:helix-turn-helix transcriptional regulator [Microbacterium trichothecenolyticum]MDQ1121828.1 transcriptional regulator with XRE-family HTH domain [Microbacterium trichothecenolyticum]
MTILATDFPWMLYMRDLGAALRRARLAAGLTQEEVAVRARISLFTYQKLEKGESNPGTPANPRLQTLLALSAALGVSVVDLVPDLSHWQDDRGSSPE